MDTLNQTNHNQDRFFQLYNLYLEGHSYRAIGRRFKISGERVRQILDQYANVEQRQILREEINRRRDTSWQTTEISALLESGRSCREVAELLNLSIHRIKRLSARRTRQIRKEKENV